MVQTFKEEVIDTQKKSINRDKKGQENKALLSPPDI